MLGKKCSNCGIELEEFKPVTFGNIELLDRGDINFEGQRISLPRCQYEIVEALVLAQGRALTSSHLAGYLGGEIYDQSIAVYVGRVRSTFRSIEPDFAQIESVQGFGSYKWIFKSAPKVMSKSRSSDQNGKITMRETIQ